MSNLKIAMVPFGHVHEVYSAILPFIKKMEPWNFGRVHVDDISATLFSDKVQLWIVFDAETKIIHGYLATEIRSYPRNKVLSVIGCGGEDGKLDECVEQVLDIFEDYAKDCGCGGLDFQGRPAWAKFVKARGYETPMRHYYKRIEGEPS